jgi:hypothetical protein
VVRVALWSSTGESEELTNHGTNYIHGLLGVLGTRVNQQQGAEDWCNRLHVAFPRSILRFHG